MFTTHEQEKLMISMAAIVAKDRKKRGVKLNYPEAISIITSQILEWAREGKSVPEIMSLGTTVLRKEDLMEGISEMIPSIQVEATFPDGTTALSVFLCRRSFLFF